MKKTDSFPRREYLARRKKAREEAAFLEGFEKTKALGNKLLVDSGARGTSSPLVAFLYELMRDHVPVGVVQEVLSHCPKESTRFTNGYLAGYAQWVARGATPMSSKFGDYLRAGRLGYGYVKGLDVFVRITGPYLPQSSYDKGRYAAVKGPWLLDVALHAVDMKPLTNEQHRCWWEGDREGIRLLEVCPALTTWLDKPKSFYWVDEDGKEIESG